MENEIEILEVLSNPSALLVRVVGTVAAGFPSPAADYMEETIDLEQYLRPNPVSTFIVKCKGDSMIDAHIPPDAILVVDKAITVSNNKIVVAVVNGEFVLKYFIKNTNGIFLMPANKRYKPLRIEDGMDFSIWGVVTKIIISA